MVKIILLVYGVLCLYGYLYGLRSLTKDMYEAKNGKGTLVNDDINDRAYRIFMLVCLFVTLTILLPVWGLATIIDSIIDIYRFIRTAIYWVKD